MLANLRAAPGGDGGRWRPGAFSAVFLLVALHGFWTLAGPPSAGIKPWFANLLIDGSHALAAILVLCVAFRYRGSRVGLGWGLVGVGLLFGLFADASWSYQELVLQREVPFPSVSDAGYIGAYIPVFIGLLVMPLAPVRGPARLKLVLDTLILMAALGVISWSLVIGTALSHTGESALQMGLSVFYPLGDLGIIFAAFILVARAGRSRAGLAFALLAVGYAAAALSDSAYMYAVEAGYEVGDVIDIGWVVSNALISIAALTRLGAGGPQRAPQEHAPAFWPSLLPYGAVIPLGALLLVESSSGDPSMLIAGGVIAVIALIILRQVLTIYENVKLNGELASLTEMLEVRVKEKTMEVLRRSRPGGEVQATGERPSGADEPVGGLGSISRPWRAGG